MGAFGDYIKQQRMALGMTLRAFCAYHEEDPSNWSKLERGILRPPLDDMRLSDIAHKLALDQDQVHQIKDLACAEAGRIPQDIMNDADVLALLPIVFRTIRNEAPSRDKLE